MESKIGFIGLGEAGYFMAKGLAGEGVKGIKAFDVALGRGGEYRQTVIDRAKDAGVELAESIAELVASRDIVFCAVQARYAQEAAAAALPAIRPGTTFVDVTTAKPARKEAVAETFAGAGIPFVDGAMMGALPVDAHKVPMLCSGTGAEELCARMNAFGMRMQFVPGKAGMASIQKLVRSSFTKGIEALSVETLLFARKMGVEEETLQSLAKSYGTTPFDQTMIRLIRSDAIHAERRAHEVEDCADLMRECGVEPVMAGAVIERLRRTAALNLKEELGGVTPAAAEEVYALWSAKNYS